MPGLGTLLRTLKAAVFQRDREEAEMAQELNLHMERRAEDLLRKGLSREEAKRKARIEFGSVEGYKEICREARGYRMLDEWMGDIRYAFRMLCKNLGFTATAVFSLALGIGVNLSSFAALSAMVLHPFAYPQLDRIMTLAETRTSAPAERYPVAPANYLDWKQRSHSFEWLSAYRDWNVNLTGVARPDHIHAALAGAEFFQVLGVMPRLGRTFTSAECQPGHDGVVVVSAGFWQSYLAGASDAIGKTISLGRRCYTVIGVMPEEFNFPLASALWAPLALSAEDKAERRTEQFSVIGKLRPGVSEAQAGSEMNTLARQLEKQYPLTNEERRVKVTSLRDLMKTESDRFLLVLACAALFVLLLACTNVSGLQVARAMGREKEIGLRYSLGAGRMRIFRQLFTESLMTGLAGGALGIALAAWDLNIIRSNIPPMVYRIVAGIKDMRLNGEVAAYALALSVAASVLCCLPAVFQMARSGANKDLGEALKEGGRNSNASPLRSRIRTVLVVAEVALAFILLVSAGLMVGTLQRIMTFNLGYDSSNVLTAQISLAGKEYEKPGRAMGFYDSVLRDLQQTKEVEAAALSGLHGATSSVLVEGREPSRPGEPLPEVNAANSQYLRVMRLPLLKGRWISDQDGPRTMPVVVLSASIARQYWPNANPIGARLKFEADSPWLTVVGVTGDVKDWFLGEPIARAYLPYRQAPGQRAMLLVRGNRDSRNLVGALRAATEKADREQPIYDVQTLEQRMYEETSGIRNAANMMTTYAVVALLLAISGIYSISSFFVTQRTREIGVRMSLGATRQTILKMVLRQSCGMTGIGLLIGVPIAILLTIGMSHALYNVVAVDRRTFVVILAILGAAGALAGYVPARRAAKVNPMVALRHE